ncbi:DNA-binding protein inhibitor ID-4 [Turdus rufiventris]|nr:DNA-binding protein inhibitor ID-4 [Turdus rufiventris]
MKAVSPVRHPSRKAQPGVAGGGGGHPALRCLAEHSGCKGGPPSGEEPAALCLQCDMNDCYSRLRKLVPTIPPNKRVSKVEILQHVIDYILDLQLALETHPALLRQQPPPPALHPGSCPAGTPRTPLTALNTDPINGSFEALTIYPRLWGSIAAGTSQNWGSIMQKDVAFSSFIEEAVSWFMCRTGSPGKQEPI